jgi:hypothetical protein
MGDAESASLLFLVPLVGMAGADGTVSYAERALVKEFARKGGIAPASRASATLDGWLHDPPAGETLDGLLTLLRDVLAGLPRDQADEIRGRLQHALERIGRSSGGLFGIGALSRTERRFLARMTSVT